jgi:tRNA(fMet)-specific endonuclease VapC
MTYLLDTDTFSNLPRNHSRVELRYALVGTAATCISTVTVQEIEFGRLLHPERMTRYNTRINALLREIPILPFDFDDACTSGRIEAVLRRAGKRIGEYDVLIAGTALARGLILVTSNTREFCRVDGLQLEDWREPTLEVREPLHAANRYRAAARSVTSHPIMG